jgi:hypothetical protein
LRFDFQSASQKTRTLSFSLSPSLFADNRNRGKRNQKRKNANMLLRNVIRPLERCLGVRLGGGDALMWQMELKPHATGDFSIAVVQANHSLEDQGQVVTSPSATFVGVYDGHGGPEASRFVSSRLFPHLHSKFVIKSFSSRLFLGIGFSRKWNG